MSTSNPPTPRQLTKRAFRRIASAQDDINAALSAITGDKVMIADLSTARADLACAQGRLSAVIQRLDEKKEATQ